MENLMQIRSNVPIPPPLKERGKWNWLNVLEVGQSIHFEEYKKFENARRTLRTRGFQTVTRKMQDSWVIWITQRPE
jgi:hypothetical protein